MLVGSQGGGQGPSPVTGERAPCQPEPRRRAGDVKDRRFVKIGLLGVFLAKRSSGAIVRGGVL
jgi:hypothetical protein